MTPAEFVDDYYEQQKKIIALPGASVDEQTYFATEEHHRTSPENMYVHQQNLTSSSSPKSST